MAWYYLGIILLLVGVVEYFIDEYQQLLAVRLKVAQTLFFAVLNRFMDLIVDIFAFAILMQFWEQLKKGNYAIEILFPYLLYLLGCVIGTGLALVFYKKYKKTFNKKQRLQHLEKARSIKKQIEEFEKDLTTAVEVEIEDEFNAELENSKETSDATKEVHNKVDGHRPPIKKAKHKKNPPQ